MAEHPSSSSRPRASDERRAPRPTGAAPVTLPLLRQRGPTRAGDASCCASCARSSGSAGEKARAARPDNDSPRHTLRYCCSGYPSRRTYPCSRPLARSTHRLADVPARASCSDGRASVSADTSRWRRVLAIRVGRDRIPIARSTLLMRCTDRRSSGTRRTLRLRPAPSPRSPYRPRGSRRTDPDLVLCSRRSRCTHRGMPRIRTAPSLHHTRNQPRTSSRSP